jgi:arylsulfatase A-like enzyme
MNKQISLLMMVLVLLWMACGKSRPQVVKPNIILIAVDTLRADHLGCYGYAHPTSPHLDDFAKRALLFEYAFCPIPKTSASFASMLTGLHPCIHQTRPNRSPLDENLLTLPELLQAHGYHTAAVVDNANLSSSFRFNQGFASYTEVWNEVKNKNRSTAFITEKVLSFLAASRKKPFFLWVNYIETHVPYVPPPRFVPLRPAGRDVREVKNRIVPKRMWLEMKKNNQFSEGYHAARYDGAVSYIDAEIGKILDFFFHQGLDKDTVFIFLADHGEDLGERNYFFEHGTLTFTDSVRIPMMLHVPGRKAGTVRTPVSIMDIYPTVLDLLRLQAPYPLQGVSLLAPRKDRLLYILGIGSHAVVKNHSHFVKVSPKIAAQLKLAPYHFYDLLADPRESRNLYEGQKAAALALAAQYNEYLDKHEYFGARKPGRGKGKLSEKDKKNLETLGYL